MKFKFALLLACIPAIALAQNSSPLEPIAPVNLEHKGLPDLSNYNNVVADTLEYYKGSDLTVVRDTILDPLRVVTNHFNKNWFIFGTLGAHTFQGDYSGLGKFSGTTSPDWSVGIGKWFTPGVALKVEFIRSESRGYTEYLTGHYGYGPYLITKDNTPYRRMKTGWWDISGDVILNFTRLFNGYEGIDSRKHMNQFMGAIGIGGVHHLGFDGHGSDNEWGGHIELQYSRFFTRSKRISLDLKLRGIFYQTNFDLEYGQADHAANKWDSNLGVDLGFTLYLGKKRPNGWGRNTTAMYQRDYRQRDVVAIYEKTVPAKTVDYGTMTFYVFYPNNYSGRNDAPIVPGKSVNAIEYLTGGIFTQKEYTNNADVQRRIATGSTLNGLAVKDIPTEPTNQNFDIDYVPRGYEMLDKTPLSLSLNGSDMQDFASRAGYYYAPIYDGTHTWQYRIDEETYGQNLLSDENYRETASFGLNSHKGLDKVREHMNVADNELLVSLADVYAAVTSNEGYISQFADPETVAMVNKILNEGVITLIQCEGLATSQDNYTGENAKQVGWERNSALSENRANTVIQWLKQNHPRLEDTSSQIFLLNNIQRVDDKSTRSLTPKLNRSVKVKIHYMIP